MKVHKRTIGVVIGALAAVSAGVYSGLAKDAKRAGPRPVYVFDGSPVHDVGELRIHMGNWGAFGSWPGSSFPFSAAPSGEWPAGSGVEHVYAGGLWVGAIKDGTGAVSTAAYESFEFTPLDDPINVVYRTGEGARGGTRPPWLDDDDDGDGAVDEDRLDGRDNDGDGRIDEDFAAISNQMFARWYTDDRRWSGGPYPMHYPLRIDVFEQTYQWAADEFDDFVGFDYEITNVGDDVLEDVYVGILLDGDVGKRDVPYYWTDDMAGFRDVPSVSTPYGDVPLQYGYVCDGSGGSCIALLLLNHTTDPTGRAAPTSVHWTTFAPFHGGAKVPYEEGGHPQNDYERYQAMSSQTIQPDANEPGDYSILLCTGPYSRLAPGETLHLSTALVGMPTADDTDNPALAAIAYRGQWVDRDVDPSTGAGGKECHVPWLPPGTGPPAVTIPRLDARADGGVVRLEWDIVADEPIAGVELLRASGTTGFRPVVSGYLPGDARAWVDPTVNPGVPYVYKILVVGESTWITASMPARVTVSGPALALYPSAPNPFRSTTTVTFSLLEPTSVDLAVYDVAGRRVVTLATGPQIAGEHELEWNGTNDAGERVGTGIYFCKLVANGQRVTRKIAVLR